jgi:hypothetical protein
MPSSLTKSPAASRIADAFIARQAYDEVGRSPYGYDPGHVEPFEPTVGEGSQVPFARDHQGKPVAPPDLGTLEIPGYEWHDTSKAFHQVVMKNANGEPMKLGINVQSFKDRKAGWWGDFIALIKEYWSFQQVPFKQGPGGFSFEVQQGGLLRVEVRGPAERPTVRVLGKTEKKFDADTSLWDILMWIDGVSRNGFTASTTRTASDITLADVAGEIGRANEVLHDAADMLDARVRGYESLSDTYGEAANASGVLRTISHTLANIEKKLESAGRGRTASGGMDLAKEMRTLQKNVTEFVMSEHTRIEDLVFRQFRANGFRVNGVRVQHDHGWLNIEGDILDDADQWRSRAEVDALFETMFDTTGQLSGNAPHWKFTMGGFQSY